jgi:hypothetical protein
MDRSPFSRWNTYLSVTRFLRPAAMLLSFLAACSAAMLYEYLGVLGDMILFGVNVYFTFFEWIVLRPRGP